VCENISKLFWDVVANKIIYFLSFISATTKKQKQEYVENSTTYPKKQTKEFFAKCKFCNNKGYTENLTAYPKETKEFFAMCKFYNNGVQKEFRNKH
jgi:hypothetical protein